MPTKAATGSRTRGQWADAECENCQPSGRLTSQAKPQPQPWPDSLTQHAQLFAHILNGPRCWVQCTLAAGRGHGGGTAHLVTLSSSVAGSGLAALIRQAHNNDYDDDEHDDGDDDDDDRGVIVAIICACCALGVFL